MNIKKLIYSSLFAALTAVFSQISVHLPFTPVPINLALVSVMIGGAVLGAKYSTLSVFVYILIGAIGVPVFANFGGGISVLIGSTGGYIVGYIFTALIVGIVSDKKRGNTTATVIAMIFGTLACYLVGTIYFVLLTHNGVVSALCACVLPFLPGDALKIVASVLATEVFLKHRIFA